MTAKHPRTTLAPLLGPPAAAKTPKAGPRLPAICFLDSERLFRLARQLTGDESDAEDLLQETWVRALRAAASLHTDEPYWPWLVTIMRRAHIDRWRTGRHRPAEGALPLDDRLIGAAGFEPCPILRDEGGLRASESFDACMQFCLSDETRQAVDELPEKYRDILLLRVFGEYSYDELASQLGIPVGTVMSRLARARQALLQRLKQGHDG